MKSISIAFNTPAITIPLGYHHSVQGLIYTLLGRGSGEEAFHDEGFHFGQRQYKLFTFSSLRGGKITEDKRGIFFERTMYLDVRSVREDFCAALLTGLKAERDLALCGKPLTVRDVTASEPHISDNKLRIQMLSPLTLHKTDDDGKSDTINPLHDDFSTEMNNNFARKYHAFTGRKPESAISIRAKAVGMQDKYVTRYKKVPVAGGKDIYIVGWRGEYELRGIPEYLDFLYYCGLGARNSDGFGMFGLLNQN
jgi:CRISPR-associated endoribonuclease Cas6